MTAPTPPKLYTNNPTETSIHVWWQGPLPQGVLRQELVVREFPKPWDEARLLDVGASSEHTVTGLFPTSTFQFRMLYVLEDGTRTPPGPTTDCDTLAAGCAPKDSDGEAVGKKKGCNVQ
jgi:hypothetical protein